MQRCVETEVSVQYTFQSRGLLLPMTEGPPSLLGPRSSSSSHSAQPSESAAVRTTSYLQRRRVSEG
jgi:hypothetical protein